MIEIELIKTTMQSAIADPVHFEMGGALIVGVNR